jgi:hypothetical protein
MSAQSQPPARLASEDVIINAPMSYVGSAQRIMRLRRLAPGGWQKNALTVLAVVLVLAAWTAITGWYLTWGILLVPYRLLRRGSRKRKAEAMRHRELMNTIQASAAASSATIAAGAIPVVSAGVEQPMLTE